MNSIELFILLLAALCAVAIFAERTRTASPIAFLLGGLVLGLIPGIGEFTIPPEYMLLIFLPPLLTESAYFSSLRDLRANLRPILQLAIVLIMISTVSVALAMFSAIPELTLAAAFVLGAIVSPPDAVAAAGIVRHAHLPKRIVTILEGESLINDATGLVLYQFAVAAAVTGMFSFSEASAQFVWMALAGLSIGFALGRTYMMIFPRMRELSVEILSTFLAPYVAYVLAEAVHASGVLAVVASGLTVGWHAPRYFMPSFRIPAEAVWKMMTFVLNGIVFIMIGMQFPGLLARLSHYAPQTLVWYAMVLALVVIGTRFIAVYAFAYGTRFLFPSIRAKDPYPSWQNIFIIAWTGMRGVVSLATALALPLTIVGGAEFPSRDLIIFLSCALIFITLILQGIPLPWIIRKLSLTFDGKALQEDWEARMRAARAGLQLLEELAVDESGQSAALERITSHYRDRIESLGDGPNTPLYPGEPPTANNHPLIQNENRIWQQVLDAERKAVICLRQTYRIGDDVMHEVLREIDLLHTRFKVL